MRDDMDKVLVERPRVGGCGKARIRQNRRAAKADPENAEQFRSMTKIHSSKGYDDRKELNENLKPFRRFLRSRLGRPWNKVYSEIMAGLNLKNAVQYHVWQHLILHGEVELKTFMQGKSVMVGTGGEPYEIGKDHWRGEQFYVHPKTGLLCVTEKRPKSYYNRPQSFSQDRYIDRSDLSKQYHRIKDVWYEVACRIPTSDEKKNQSFGHYHSTVDVKGQEKKTWVHCSYMDSLVTQLMVAHGVNEYAYYSYDRLWRTCARMCGGAYPISKKQISSKEVRRVEELISQRDKRKRAA